ncbi:MAG: hypothetical protein WC133_00475 [Candidatus Omnitrophota bacterium]
MRKKPAIFIIIFILMALLVGSIWFAMNLIAYNKCWEGLSPAVRDEWESTGESGSNPFFDFMKRGFGSGCPTGLEALQEPETSIQELRDAVQQLEKKNDLMQAEIDDIKSNIKKAGPSQET